MGNDGGSIPTRRELVKSAARAPTATELRETLREHLAHAWSTCPLSHKPLAPPIVSDAIGNLYNKDSILQFLLPDRGDGSLNRDDAEKVLGGRVRGLKDVVEVRFTPDPDEGRRASKGGFVCPITAKALGPAVRAVYLVPCGHAFSEEAIREVKSTAKGGEKGPAACLECNEPYEADHIIPILPTGEAEKARLRARIDRLKEEGLAHSLKKAGGKKRKKGDAAPAPAAESPVPGGDTEASKATNGVSAVQAAAAAAATADPAVPARSATSTPHPPPSRSGTSTPVPAASNGIKNAATASLTARVLAEEAERAKRRKLAGENENVKTLFASSARGGGGGSSGKDGDFMTRGYSIPAGARR